MQLNNSAHYYQFPKRKIHEILKINRSLLQRKDTKFKTLHIGIFVVYSLIASSYIDFECFSLLRCLCERYFMSVPVKIRRHLHCKVVDILFVCRT